jgi:hypothetical protein
MILVGERQPPSRPRRVPAKLKLTLLCRGNHPLLQRGLERGQRLSGLALLEEHLGQELARRECRAADGVLAVGGLSEQAYRLVRLSLSLSDDTRRNASPGS